MRSNIPLVIIGAGGFGREALDVVHAQNAASASPKYNLLGIIDSNPSLVNLSRLRAMGVPYLGTEQEWLSADRQAEYLVGIGDPATKKRISGLFDAQGNVAGKAVHPSAAIGSLSQLSEGTVVCGGVQISTNVRLGRHVHVNPNVTIGHDSEIHDFASLNPGSIISGNVRCEANALVGAGAVILQGLIIGHGTTVGAAACVTKSIPPHTVVKGVPAR